MRVAGIPGRHIQPGCGGVRAVAPLQHGHGEGHPAAQPTAGWQAATGLRIHTCWGESPALLWHSVISWHTLACLLKALAP